MAEAVPRIVHLIWLGSAVPARVEQLRGDIARHDPTVEVRVWRDDDLAWLRNHDLLLREPRFSAKADIARFEILLRHGGIYLDADFRVHRTIAPVLDAIDEHRLVVARQSPSVYNCAFIGAAAGHPLMQDLVEHLPEAYRWTGRMSAPATTGPHYFTERLLVHLRAGGSALELPQHAVFPWYADEDPLPAEVLPDSVVMSHEWAMISDRWSWGTTGEAPEAAVPVPDRRTRQARNGGSIRARAAATPVVHGAVAAVERLRTGVRRTTTDPTGPGAGLTATPAHLDQWCARQAGRHLRGSAAFLDVDPDGAAPALAAIRVLDRPGRVIVVGPAGTDAVVGTALWDGSSRCSVALVEHDRADPDRVVGIRTRGTPLLARTISAEAPPLDAWTGPVPTALADLIGAVPRFDLARVRASSLTEELARTIGTMTAQRRIARLLITLDPFDASPGIDRAVAAIADLEGRGLPVHLAPWLVDGRGRTWREHLRAAARPFLVVIGP